MHRRRAASTVGGRSLRAACAAAAVLTLLSACGSSDPIAPTEVVRTEAELLAAPPTCWQTISWGELSGGQGRSCATPGIPLSWNVDVPPKQVGVLTLYGYRDALPRGFRVRIDGAAWTSATVVGPVAGSVSFFTSPDLSAGSHRVEFESVPPEGFTLDRYELRTHAAEGGLAEPAPAPQKMPPREGPLREGAPPGDGGTCNIDPADGETAIAAAIAACPDGTTVRFPPDRTYHQTDKIAVTRRRGLVIDGNGSRFIKTTPAGPVARPNWELLENRNLTLENMTIQGSLAPGPRGITPGNQYDHGVSLLGGDGTTIRDVTVHDVFGDFVTTAPSGFAVGVGGGALGGEVPRDVTIQRLNGRGAARMCVGLTAGIGIVVEDSVLSDCRYAGIDMETDVPGEPLRDVRILRNRIAGYYLFAIGIAGPVDAPPNAGDIAGIEIRENVTTTTSDTCWAAVFAARGPISNVVIADNRLKSATNGVRLSGVVSGSVRDNAIQITGTTERCGKAEAAPAPVRVDDAPAVAVSGNTRAGP